MQARVEVEDLQTFKRIACMPSGLHEQSELRLVPLTVDGAFVLKEFLSERECSYFIDETEKLSYSSLDQEYNPAQRNNDRVVALSTETAAVLFERIKQFVPSELAAAKGTWDLCGLNEAFRFCRYAPGGHFSPHYDGDFVRNHNERSFYTINIYLNGGFGGGTTNFLARTYADISERQITDQVVPEPGLALVFPHDRLHEGDRLQDGVKYLMRTDVMYRRRGAPAAATSATGEHDEKYLQAVNMFQQASLLERKGEAHEAMLLYRRAFKMCPELESQQLV